MRFFAALLVVIGHTQHALLERLGAAAGRYAFVPLDWGLGVDVFFVISGFVMYYLMHDRFAQAGATATFLRRRVVRVVPMYWLFTTLVLAVGLATGAVDLPWTNILFSYLFLPGPVCGEYCFPVFTLGWTINYEMLFYALFAIALGFPRRIGVAVVVGLIAGLIVMGQAVPVSWSMLHFWGYPIIGEFLFGIGLAAGFLRGWRVSRGAGWALVAAGLVLATVSYQLDLYDHIWRLWTGGIPAALILGGAVFGLEPRGAHGRWLAVLVVGGDASYALYLSHPVTISRGRCGRGQDRAVRACAVGVLERHGGRGGDRVVRRPPCDRKAVARPVLPATQSRRGYSVTVGVAIANADQK
ncbi:acyltransferase family protein [Sphingomonas hankookensis]|uniref:acyltransferase family protein n=1 Tax=Sphingomonas hankookensis TaxID=563996 RepID=UPI003F7AEC34